jgi:hypothetical protein
MQTKVSRSLLVFVTYSLACLWVPGQTTNNSPVQRNEYLWYEAENMRGFSTNAQNEPILNPSWQEPPRATAPGWGMNGPGVSAEWSQGGESEWNSAAASADETHATIFQDIEVPRAGLFNVWVRYADWAGKTENFIVRISRDGRDIFRHEFGVHDVVDPHDEVSMYWGWAFAWDHSEASLGKGPARLHIEIEKAAEARRHVDCVLITNDLNFIPQGRQKPDLPALRVLRAAAQPGAKPLPLLESTSYEPLTRWRPPLIADRELLMPWNIAKEFWSGYDKPPAERSLYPFNAEPIDEFLKTYKGARDVPIFSSKLVVPVVYINDLTAFLSEGSPFLRYLRETHSPFAILINYGAAQMSDAQGQAAWKLLNGELRGQFLGWISGENIGYVSPDAATPLKRSPEMDRRAILANFHSFYTAALDKKWSSTFHAQTGPMWDKLIPAQATSSTSFAHALGEWGVRLLGMETAAVQPATAMRIAFTRGAARQYEGAFLYYHAPNFGDTATTFTKQQNFGGPDNFYHSRYGPSMGPSLSWYRKSYYLYYMAGASAIYLEQGFDQFFKPGPGDHPFQLNPLGHITDEFIHFAERHPDRGAPYTPVAFLLDAAHGWDMTDYPQWPLGVSQIDRSDRSLRELFGAAYYPLPVREGEPATADRQAFVSGLFGDIFDVLVASDTHGGAIGNYRAVVAGGRIAWTAGWPQRLSEYVRKGGVLVLNAAQVKGLPADLIGARLSEETAEADDARCLLESDKGEPPAGSFPDLSGQMFRYRRIDKLKGTKVLMQTPSGDPLVTLNSFGRGKVIFCALPDLLGEDERMAPFAAHLLAHLFTGAAAPVSITGDVEYLINRTPRAWLVTLINNNGVLKPQQGLAQVDRGAMIKATIAISGKRLEEAREWTDGKRLDIVQEKDAGLVTLSIAPGGIAIVELRDR